METLTIEELNQLRASGESKYIEYKESGDISDHAEALRQLTAFANRAGGTLLYGVRDDGTMEGAAIDADSTIETVSNIVRDLTSPIVEFTPLFYHGPDGDVFVLRVLKRRGIPCAVVRRELHEIIRRKYYIRTDHGVRNVDDWTLEWLFVHQEDPSINESFRTCIQYQRNDISLGLFLHYLSLSPPFGLIQVFQNLTEEQRTFLKSEESKNMMRFLTELVPYAILGELGNYYSKSWKIRISRIGGTTSWGPIGDSSVSEQVDIGQLFESFRSEVLQNMPVDISSFITMSKVLCLPQGSSLTMDIDEKSSSISIEKPGTFNVSLKIYSTSWGVGTAPGHPLGSALGGLTRVKEQIAIQERFAHADLNMDFTAKFEFPDQPTDETQEYLDWAQQMLNEIKRQWDWDKKIDALPPGILYSIESDIKEILKRVKESKDNE